MLNVWKFQVIKVIFNEMLKYCLFHVWFIRKKTNDILKNIIEVCQDSIGLISVFPSMPLESQSWCIRDIYKTECHNIKFIQYSWRFRLRVHKQITPDTNAHSHPLYTHILHTHILLKKHIVPKRQIFLQRRQIWHYILQLILN